MMQFNQLIEKILPYKRWVAGGAGGIAIIFIFALFSSEEVKWDCFVFPSRDDLFRYQSIGEYASLELCKKAGKEELVRLHAADKGYFQCGQNCSSKSGIKTVSACKKIVH